MSKKTLKLIEEHDAKWVDLRFTDSRGKEQHVTNRATLIDQDFFKNGAMFDGSSIAGWQPINNADMILMPDDATAVRDPFTEEATINLRCDIVEPATLQGYDCDPRAVGKRAEAYLSATGIGDTAYFGPEPEFFIFDDVKFKSDIGGAMYAIESEEASWMSASTVEGGNTGHRPRVKGGYFPVPPVDSQFDIRNAMCAAMEDMGVVVDLHHHEVGTAGQAEIGTHFDTLVRKGDEVQIYKYCVHNVAHAFGKTATFMPKPLVGDNGNGMHCHQSIWRDGTNLFAGKGYGNLSQEALWYIGGIIKHARALNAFSNASTNSYKRLVPGFEAPLILVYSALNRSASIRIPYVQGANPKGVRVEVRFGDPTANPYLMFASMLMAGLDGIKNKIEPVGPIDQDLYDMPEKDLEGLPTVCSSLEQALDALDDDREFLRQDGVFTDSMIDGYIKLKHEDVTKLNSSTHPIEFEMYYSV